MKRTYTAMTAVLLVLAMMLCLSGCGNTADTSETSSEPQKSSAAEPTPSQTEQSTDISNETEEEASAPDDTGSSILVLYFSRTGEQYTVGVIEKGNTAIVAGMIAEKTGADLFEIVPADDHYPMTYGELTDVAKREQNENARPACKDELPDLSGYDTIFIGAPVWWGDWPMIMYTVFENNDFAGKKLVPFSTHEGSGLSGFDRKLASACPDSKVLTGAAFRGNDCQNRQESVENEVDNWLAGLVY